MTDQSPPPKSNFSIESILHSSTMPSGVQCHWVPPQALLQLQNKAAGRQQERRPQYLIQFLLNAGFTPPVRPLAVMDTHEPQHPHNPLFSASGSFNLPQPQALPPSFAAAAVCASARPPPPPIHVMSPATYRPRLRLKSVQREGQLCAARSPPGLINFEKFGGCGDSENGNARKRQVSIDSAGTSNDSEEENESRGGPKCPASGGHNPYPASLRVSSPKKMRLAQPHNKEMSPSFKKSRTSFSKLQIEKLEAKFSEQKYLTKLDRTHLASELGLTEKHVKTWFQNRRTKWKKDCSDADWSKHKEFAAALMYGQYLESKNHLEQQNKELEELDSDETVN